MSKNTLNSQFRKIDVDQFSEDLFKDEDQTEATSPSNGIDEKEVSNLINSGKQSEALKLLLSSAPINTKNQMAKDKAFNTVLQLLLNIKVSEIDKVIDSLPFDQIDVLMKYIYRGFETPNEGSSAHLLIWHEKTYNKGGVGAIVRVLTDKKKV
jgi:actin related protein 2/3 complex subunit 5